ncbi:MAG: hypothetical protein ACP5E9_03595 [Candidatus Methanospirareceae archaeon]
MVSRRKHNCGFIVTVILVMSLVLAVTTVTTARTPLQEDDIKSDHFRFSEHPDVQNLSMGYAVSLETGEDQLKAQSWLLEENRNVGRSTINESGSLLGGSGIPRGSGYLNLSGNFSTLWNQTMTTNATTAGIILDLDGDDNPEVMVVTTAYDSGTDIETKNLIIKKGTNGTHLWEQAVSANGRDNCSIFIDWFLDLDGDNLDDAFVFERERNASTGLEEKRLIAKRGYDGTQLWKQTVNGTECGIAAGWMVNLDEDPLDEVIVDERFYDASTDIETKRVIARDSNNGTHLWEQTVTARGYQNCSIWVDEITDLDGDSLDDVIVQIRKYNDSDDTESVTIRALKGTDGTILWSQTLRETEVFLMLYVMGDLDNDDLDDVLVEEWFYNESANLTTSHILVKKGLDGTLLWNQSMAASGYDNCAIWYDEIADLDGDNITDVFISEYSYSESMDLSTSKVIAKNGLNGTHLWERAEQTPGRATCIKFVRWITDLNGDDLDDVILFEQTVNESANSEFSRMIAKRGFDGTHLWEQSVNGTESDIWMHLAGDLDGDDLTDVVFRGWSYIESTNRESSMVIAKRGFDGTVLWEQRVNGTESDIWAYLPGDLDGDNLTDVIITEWSYNDSTNLESITIRAQKGSTGTHLWERSLTGTECNAGLDLTFDFDGDGLDDALLYEWTYNESLNLDTTKIIAKQGSTGTHLWEHSLNASGRRSTDIWVWWPFDIDGDDLGDILVIEWVFNTSSQTETRKAIAKKGTDGTNFWEQSVSGTESSLTIWSGSDLDGDDLRDFIISSGNYTESTNTSAVTLTARRGYDGTHFWEQSVNGSGPWSCDIWVATLADLDGDGFGDAVIIEWGYNELVNTTLERLIAKRGYDGVHLFEAESNELIWTSSWWGAYNLDGVGLNDVLFGISTEMYAVTYNAASQNLFDTDEPALPYPSIGGTFTGTLTPLYELDVHTLHTYPCSGTGGHSDYVRIWGDGINITATWSGYSGDWQNVAFSEPFATLLANTTYNITIELGSYPKIIHEQSLNATGGALACVMYEDVNGIIHNNWIPAIRIT